MRVQRVLGYARVSSVEQALGTSLQDQQDIIHAHAQKGGLNVHRMYVEAESAVHERAERRVQVLALMGEVRGGDLVLVDKLDRWSRDAEFSYRSIREILESGAHFFAIGDNCDPSTPDGDSALGLRILVAREEHKRIKQRLVGTRKLLRDRGYYADGLTPWGYERQDKRGLERNCLLVRADEAPVVLKAFELCIDGYSIDEIGEKLEIHRDRIAGTLRNRIYLGEVRDSKGNWIKGQHAALVPAHTFVAAASSLDRRRRGDRPGHPNAETQSWWLRDIARCALCEAKMSAAYAGPRERRRYYFYCYARCSRRWVPVRGAEAECEPLVIGRLDELCESLASSTKKETSKLDARSIETRQRRIDSLRERYLYQHAEGHITNERLREHMAKLDSARTSLDAETAAPPPVTDAQRRGALRAVGAMAKAWAGNTPAERREIVYALAKHVLLAKDKRPRFEWRTNDELARGA
jgi:DNA invertase Pin-like site-specific DNA recombinase